MNKQKIAESFAKWAKETNADYAIVETDGYGDCNTCVNTELSYVFGDDSTGVFLKHWKYGMNASAPLSEQDSVYVSHDITEEQAEKFIKIMDEEFRIFPKKYNPNISFLLVDKNSKVFKISWNQVVPEDSYYEEYVTGKKAEERTAFLLANDNCFNVKKEECK